MVSVYGKSFEIYYGYYAEFERNSIYNEPVPIYPDLKADPKYDNDGNRIVTEMQVACERYSGSPHEDSCGVCVHFKKGKKLFGICTLKESSLGQELKDDQGLSKLRTKKIKLKKLKKG